MMPSKLYLLLTILFVFVICSKSVEQKPRKGYAADDSKQQVVAESKNDDYAKDKDEDDDDAVADDNSVLTALPYNRNPSYGSTENNYRTRARWQAPGQSESPSYNDYMKGNDRPRFDLGSFLASLPTGPYDNNAIFNRGPTCYSLVDSQYPIFSDTCGAVPQARYALPNTFGHRERWQIAQILMALMSSSTNPTCTRSLRLLMCPVLFPPCPNRHEPPAVLPCQSYCRAVKARCAIPALEFLPCEVLPYSSDLCPTNQPYGSFMPPGAFPPVPPPAMADAFSAARSYPSLQSLLSSQNLQAAFASSPLSSVPSPSLQQATSSNLYNGGPYATNNLNQVLNELPSRSYGNNYLQAPRYAPQTRSSTETRASTETRSATPSSVVKA